MEHRRKVADINHKTMLFNEILKLKLKNKELEEEVKRLKDEVDGLRETVDQYEWSMGI